jgi:hypothetical protein
MFLKCIQTLGIMVEVEVRSREMNKKEGDTQGWGT